MDIASHTQQLEQQQPSNDEQKQEQQQHEGQLSETSQQGQKQEQAIIQLKGVGGKDYIDFGVKLDKEIVEKLNMKREKNYQIIIDNSGSMCGQNMEMTKQLCQILVSYIISHQPNSKVSLMTFNTSIVEHKDLQNKTEAQIKSIVSAIQACEGTIFYTTFDKLREIAMTMKSNNEELVIIYLTDGQIVNNLDHTHLKESYEFLKNTLQKFVNNVEVHALGIGSEHDPIILDRIVSLHSTLSTYQFVKTPQQIEDSFQTIVDIIEESYMECYLNRKDGQLGRISLFKGSFNHSKKIRNQVIINEKLLADAKISKDTSFLDVLNSNEFELVVVLNHALTSKVPFSVKDKRMQLTPEEDDDKKIKLQNQKNEVKDKLLKELGQQLSFIDQELKEVIQELKEYVNHHRSSMDTTLISQYCKKILYLNEQYQSCLMRVLKSRNSQKKEKILSANSSLINRMSEAVELAQKMSSSAVTTVQIAVLNQLAYPTIANKLFAKRLEKRKTASVVQFNEYEQIKIKLQKEFNEHPEELLEEMKEVDDKIGTCFLSCYSASEALLNNDCLCATFSVTRTELAIVRPESLKFKAVQPSVISATSFIDCVKYSLDISLEKSGSFKKMEGQIVQGVSREIINGAIPLFLNKTHWKMAKLWLEPLLGWVVTLDPLGYHHAQKRTVPFALINCLAKQMIQNEFTNYNLMQLNLIGDTCRQIMIEEEEDAAQLKIENSQGLQMKEEVIKQFNEFVASPISRMQDSIPNLEIFLAKVWIASQLKWLKVENQQSFFKAIIEEQFRRYIPDKNDLRATEIMKLVLHAYEDSQRLLFGQYEIPTQSLQIIHFYRYLFEGNNTKEAILSTQKIYEIKSSYEILQASKLAQMSAFLMQNIFQVNDKVRRNSIGLKRYHDPYEESELAIGEIEKARDQEAADLSYSYSAGTALRRKVVIEGTITFTTPFIKSSLQHQVNEIVASTNPVEYDLLLDELIKLKSNKQWYLWVLISYRAEDLTKKLFAVKEKLGPFKKFKNYQIYLLTKADILDGGTISSLES